MKNEKLYVETNLGGFVYAKPVYLTLCFFHWIRM